MIKIQLLSLVYTNNPSRKLPGHCVPRTLLKETSIQCYKSVSQRPNITKGLTTTK